MKPRLLCIYALALLAAPFSCISSTVISEDTVGDFHAGQIYTLNEGSNSFEGSQAWVDDPVDGFRFIIPDGYRGTIEFNYEFINLGTTEGAAWIWELYSLSSEASCTPDINNPYSCLAPPGEEHITSEIFQTPEGFVAPSGWEFDPFNTFTLETGTYQLADNLGFSDADNPMFLYSANINLVAVPIPPAIILFGSGIALLGSLTTNLSRRRASRA